MKKAHFFSGFLLLLSIVSIFSETVSAHVLVTSESGQQAGILHIIPDDDPIAGRSSTLFFDTQNRLLNANNKVQLFVTGEDGKTDKITTKIKGSLVSADYIFPRQGAYQVNYTIASNKRTYHFKEVVRVTRGELDTPYASRYRWAEGLLIMSGALLLVLVIIFWNHRRGIARQSRF